MTNQDNSDFDRVSQTGDAREMLENLGGTQTAELGKDVESGQRSRWWPFIVAATLSLVWISGLALWLSTTGAVTDYSPTSLLALRSSIISPVVIFWLVALVFQRQ